jgi:CBS domain-containing protein
MAATAPQQISTATGSATAPAQPSASGADMETGALGDTEIKANALDDFSLAMCKKPLYAIHPRRANRTVTMWKGAITVQVDDPVRHVFKTLNDENILSAPVIQANGRFFGFIDMMDIVLFTVKLFPKDADVSKESLSVFFQKEEQYFKTTVRELLEQLHPNRNWKEYRQRASVPKEFSLYYAWEAMIRRGRKRLAVVDDSQQVYSVLTQSMLIGWAYNNLDEQLKAIKDVSSRQIGYERPVISVSEHDSTISAFRLMAEKGVHGVAVVDTKGQLTDVLSIRDLRGIIPSAEEFLRLWRSVGVFKRDLREKHPTKTPVFPDLYLLPSDTVKTSIVMMDEDRVHRLFVVRSATDKTPVGVITQSDVLRFVLNLCSGKLFEDDEEKQTAGTAPAAASTTPAAPAVKPAGLAPEMASAAPMRD